MASNLKHPGLVPHPSLDLLVHFFIFISFLLDFIDSVIGLPRQESKWTDERLCDICSSSNMFKLEQQLIIYLQFTLKVNFKRAQNGYVFMWAELQFIDDGLATICLVGPRSKQWNISPCALISFRISLGRLIKNNYLLPQIKRPILLLSNKAWWIQCHCSVEGTYWSCTVRSSQSDD